MNAVIIFNFLHSTEPSQPSTEAEKEPQKKKRKKREGYTKVEEDLVMAFFDLEAREGPAPISECKKFLAEHKKGSNFVKRSPANIQEKVKSLLRKKKNQGLH